MDPNVKLLFEEGFKQLRTEMKEVAAVDQQRDSHVVVLEQTAASFDKAFSEWKPEVESSISAVHLELSKLKEYFNRDAKASSSVTPQNPQSPRDATKHDIQPPN
jgi:hypothetical protein